MWRERPARSVAEPDPAGPAPTADLTRNRLLRRLEWPILRTFARRLGGGERSRQRAAGVDLTDLREYQAGDDIRQIDWNATARSERTYVRESLAERGLDVWFLADVSASIDWGTAECLKRERTVELVETASALLTRQGNRTSALLFAGGTTGVVPPGAGRDHVRRVASLIRSAPRQPTPGPTNLATALLHLGRLVRQPSLVLIVTDFLVQPGWQAPLRTLAQRHEVIGVRVVDPREANLPDVGIVTFEDPETGDQVTVDTSDRRLRERFTLAAHKQSARLRLELRHVGASLLEISTADDVLTALVRFLDGRRHERRLPSATLRRASAGI